MIRLTLCCSDIFFYKYKTGIPFEFHTADALGYHYTANWILDMFYWGSGDVYFKQMQGVSDSGWELFCL